MSLNSNSLMIITLVFLAVFEGAYPQPSHKLARGHEVPMRPEVSLQGVVISEGDICLRSCFPVFSCLGSEKYLTERLIDLCLHFVLMHSL